MTAIEVTIHEVGSGPCSLTGKEADGLRVTFGDGIQGSRLPTGADQEACAPLLDVNPAAHAAAKAEGLEVQEDVELNSQQIERVEIEGLAQTQYEGSGMFKLDAPSSPPQAQEPADETMPQVDLPLIMPDDASAPRARAAAAPAALRPPRAPAPPPPPAPPPASSSGPHRRPAGVALSDDDGAADTATLSQAEPVLTETMAEPGCGLDIHADSEMVRCYLGA